MGERLLAQDGGPLIGDELPKRLLAAAPSGGRSGCLDAPGGFFFGFPADDGVGGDFERGCFLRPRAR